jgi:MerR family transcriptional regulator, light-induced transcriptional regulator
MSAATNSVSAPVYNLKAVVMETGLKPPTIRAWERRYGLPQPQRSAGGHRQYSQRDIDTLKWLVERQAEGMSISHAVDLWQALQAQGQDPLLEQPTISVPQSAAPRLSNLGSEIVELRRAWISACLDFDRGAAEQILARAFALFPPEVVAVDLLQAGLSEVGQLWYDDEISVQQEHFTSAMSVQRLDMLIAAVPPPVRAERIVVASAQDDYHVFSPLLLTYLLRRRGWDVLYLGADVPVAELEETIAQTQPQLLIISTQLLTTAASIVDVISALADQPTMVAYGGIIFNTKPELRERIAAYFLGPTIDGAVETVELLLRTRPPRPSVPALEQDYSDALAQFNRQRSLIESQVWTQYAESGKPTKDLVEMNQMLAGIIIAALKFGDAAILSQDMEWIQYLMASFRLDEGEVRDYIAAYHQAAAAHLGGPAQIPLTWLEGLLAGN